MSAAWMFVDDVLQRQLDAYLSDISGDSPYTYHLYQNDVDPDDDSVLADFDECDFTGYLPVSIAPSNFGAAAVVDHIAISTSSVNAEYESDPAAAAQTTYGYYVTDVADDLLWAESFATPRAINPTDTFELTPRLKHRTCRES
jgi:hypothetical protein